MSDFTGAVERIVAGLEKKSRILIPRERRVVAYHEMGHALVALAIPGSDPMQKVSIIPRGIGALGYTLQRPTDDRFLMGRQELEDKMTVLMGGRAAEMLLGEDISTGAADDLAKATDIARGMVLRFGMDERLGPVAWDTEQGQFLNQPGAFWRPRRFSDETAHEIDQAVRVASGGGAGAGGGDPAGEPGGAGRGRGVAAGARDAGGGGAAEGEGGGGGCGVEDAGVTTVAESRGPLDRNRRPELETDWCLRVGRPKMADPASAGRFDCYRPKAVLQPAPLNVRMAAASGHPALPPPVNIRRGKVTTNSVNSSTSLSTEIVPACAFVTMSWVIDRPRPVPSPVGLVVKNGWNSLSGAIAIGTTTSRRATASSRLPNSPTHSRW